MPSFKITTLRPGIMVGLKTTIKGNVSSSRVVLNQAEEDSGALVTVAETTRRIEDPKEQEAAVKVRSKARSLIRGICSESNFGLLCAESRRSILDERIAEARKLCDDFNATAMLTTISFNVMCGRVASDDFEAVRAINSELRDLLEAMQAGIASMDVEAVRSAASKARQLGQMLSSDAQVKVKEAIDAARGAAREIAKAGETAAKVVNTEAIAAIARSRTAFLDLEPAAEVAPVQHKGVAVDFEPEAVDVIPPPGSKRRAPAVEIEL